MDSLGDMTGDPDLIRDFDHLVLKLAVLELHRAIEAGAKYVAMVPIHVESLTRDQDQRALLQVTGAAAAGLAPTADTGDCRYEEIPVQRSGAAHLDAEEPLPADHSAAGCNAGALAAVATSAGRRGRMSMKTPGAELPEPEIVAAMNGFVKAISRHGIETYLFDLRTRSLAFAAIGAGFSQIAGRRSPRAAPHRERASPRPAWATFLLRPSLRRGRQACLRACQTQIPMTRATTAMSGDTVSPSTRAARTRPRNGWNSWIWLTRAIPPKVRPRVPEEEADQHAETR